jgi:DNA-binding transcriptional MerR regulator/methylmalonyl-CoA mutase cobalamin-binding subunit
MDKPKQNEHMHPIRVVSQRSGVRPDVLRAWERRYSAVKPYRSKTGRRLYSDGDIARLRLLRMAVEAGRRISDVASLSDAELERLVEGDDPGRDRPPISGRRDRAPKPGDYLRDILGALERLDKSGIEQTLSEAEVSLSKPELRRELLVPLIHNVGDLWHTGALRIFHEHLASAVIRSVLGSVYFEDESQTSGQVILITTPSGHLHELGAMLAVSAAVDAGWGVLYFGPNLPPDEIAAAAIESGADAIGLSLVYPPRDRRTESDLRRLRHTVGPDIPILAGGRSAHTYAAVLAEINAITVPDLAKFQERLHALSLS